MSTCQVEQLTEIYTNSMSIGTDRKCLWAPEHELWQYNSNFVKGQTYFNYVVLNAVGTWASRWTHCI